MPRVDLTLEIDIERTPRVKQLEGMFDVPETKRQTVDYHFDVPTEKRGWQIGLIVGPSGAGKTVTARHLFPDNMVDEYSWHPKKSVIDNFNNIGIKDITMALSSVGFSSPPSWMKPYHVLSNGEQFRTRVARALLDSRNLVVMDEFTSVVDRTVAKIGSCAVAKAIRKQPQKRFVAVSCHDDIIEWLQPDWVLEPHVGRFQWRSVQPRPPIKLTIVRCEYSSWQWFVKHHYLSADLHKAARCFVGMIDEQPVCFAGLIYFPHPVRKDIIRISRVVVLPDYQGIGIAAHHFTQTIAKIAKANGFVLATGMAHPALLKSRAKSPHWKTIQPYRINTNRRGRTSTINVNPQHTFTRRVAHFHYVGPGFTDAKDIAAAKKLWSNQDAKKFAKLKAKGLRALRENKQ